MKHGGQIQQNMINEKKVKYGTWEIWTLRGLENENGANEEFEQSEIHHIRM